MASHFREKRPIKPSGRPKAVAVLGWLTLLCGAILLLSPDIYEASYSLRSKPDLEAARRAVEAVYDKRGEGPGSEEESASADALAAADKADSSRPWLEAYNERVRGGEGPAVNDPFTFGAQDSSFSETGLVDVPVGVLTVESMSCEAPVYLGSTEENMLRGAAVVAGTSAPLGEASSNCVIAAHRGMYFRQVENVQIGDLARLRTIWGTFVYRVVDIRVIYPTDRDAVRIQEGRDLLTLTTCHPYGQNKKRIIVVCERDLAAEAQPEEPESSAAQEVLDAVVPKDAASNVAETFASHGPFDDLFIEDCGRLLGRVLLVLLAVRLMAAVVRSKKSKRLRSGQ